MDGRESVEKLLDAERKCLETVRHDPKEVEVKVLCELRIGIYHKVLSRRPVADFKDDKEIDDLKAEVDELAFEMKTTAERLENAVRGLSVRRALSMAAE